MVWFWPPSQSKRDSPIHSFNHSSASVRRTVPGLPKVQIELQGGELGRSETNETKCTIRRKNRMSRNAPSQRQILVCLVPPLNTLYWQLAGWPHNTSCQDCLKMAASNIYCHMRLHSTMEMHAYTKAKTMVLISVVINVVIFLVICLVILLVIFFGHIFEWQSTSKKYEKMT